MTLRIPEGHVVRLPPGTYTMGGGRIVDEHGVEWQDRFTRPKETFRYAGPWYRKLPAYLWWRYELRHGEDADLPWWLDLLLKL